MCHHTEDGSEIDEETKMKHIMIDLEMNTINKEHHEVRAYLKREIIEIGAVMMDDEFHIINEINIYIKPQFNPIVDKIKELTGISNEIVDGSETFEQAMETFLTWIGDGDVTMYSWSEHDLTQLKKECAYKGISNHRLEYLFDQWVDFQEEFGRLLGIEKKISLNYAIGSAELSFEGKEHNALDDARNTARILQLSKNKQEFERVMEPIIELFRPKQTTFSIGDLIPKEFFQNDVT